MHVDPGGGWDCIGQTRTFGHVLTRKVPRLRDSSEVWSQRPGSSCDFSGEVRFQPEIESLVALVSHAYYRSSEEI